MITENLSTLKIHKLTKEQYNRELQAGNIDENALYLTPEEEIDLSPYATIEQLNAKADASTVNAALNQKVSRNDFETALDLKVSTSQIANNLTTTESGYVLDARQGKILDDTITSTATALQNYSDGNLDLAKEYIDTKISDLETNKVNNSIKDLSVEGKVITFTKQDGTSSTITTQDTDKNVTQTVRTTNGAFPVLLRGTSAGTTTTTTTATFATAITANPSTGKITATGFVGDLTGNATSATQAMQDSEGNVINTTYETKGRVTEQINATKEYAAELVNSLSTKVDQNIEELGKLGSAAYQESEYFTNDAQTKATSAETAAKAYAKEYADGIKDSLLNGAGSAYDTLHELGILIDENTDAIDALEQLTQSHISYVSEQNLTTDEQMLARKNQGLYRDNLDLLTTVNDIVYQQQNSKFIMPAIVTLPSIISMGDSFNATFIFTKMDNNNVQYIFEGNCVVTNSSRHFNFNGMCTSESDIQQLNNTTTTDWVVGDPFQMIENGRYRLQIYKFGITYVEDKYIPSSIARTSNVVLKSDTIAINHGGTGATTAAGALLNLGLTVTAEEINAVVNEPNSDWNENDISSPNYIKNKPFGTGYEVGNFVTSSTLSALSYNGIYYYLTVAKNIPYYSDTYSDFKYMGYVEIDGESFLYKTTIPFYKTLYMYFVFNQGTDKYYDIFIRGSQSDLKEIQSKSVKIYNANAINNPLSIDFGGTGAADADTALTNLGATYTINAIADLTAAFNAMPLHSTRNVWILGTVFKTLTNNLDAGNQAHGYMTKLTDSVLELRVGGGGYHWTIRFDGSSATSQYRATDNIAYQTTDLTAGSSSLSTGHMMLVYS